MVRCAVEEVRCIRQILGGSHQILVVSRRHLRHLRTRTEMSRVLQVAVSPPTQRTRMGGTLAVLGCCREEGHLIP